jgi:hypothetical protein
MEGAAKTGKQVIRNNPIRKLREIFLAAHRFMPEHYRRYWEKKVGRKVDSIPFLSSERMIVDVFLSAAAFIGEFHLVACAGLIVDPHDVRFYRRQ